MSLANSVRITHNKEVLCCLDQTEVKAVEPFFEYSEMPVNIWKRGWSGMYSFLTGKKSLSQPMLHCSEKTRIRFKDGTEMILRMPFLEFVNAYC